MVKISFVRSLLILTLAVLAITITIQAKTSGATKAPEKRIVWRSQLKPALEEAGRTGKPVLLYFYSESCPPCREMNTRTYTHAKVVAAAARWIPVKVNGEMDLETAYDYKVGSFPKIILLNPDGSIAAQSSGFRTAAELLQAMRAVSK